MISIDKLSLYVGNDIYETSGVYVLDTIRG